MATLFQILQFFDGNGAPLSGGKIYWYISGTTTLKDTWRDQGKVQAHTNPIILNDDGTIPDGSGGRGGIWLDGSYKIKITDSSDTLILTQDVINAYDQLDWTGLTATIADLNSTSTNTISKNTTYAITIADRNKTILADATSAPFTINLPAAATVGNKFRIYIKKVDVTSNAVTVDGNLAETVDGQTTYELNDYNDNIGIHSDGSNWHLISSQIRGTVLAKSSAYPVILNDNTKLVVCNATGGAFNVTLPAVNTVGSGFRVAVKKTDSSSNGITVVTPGVETIDGEVSFVVAVQYNCYEFVTDGVNWFIRNDYQSDDSAPYPKGYFSGIELSNDSGDLSHDINFAVGAVRDEANSVNLKLDTPLIKQINAPWAQGTNQGGTPGTVSIDPNTQYHVYLIGKPDGTVDGGFDEVGDLTASKLLTAAGAAGFTVYRRIATVVTDASSNIDPFLNRGNYFYWNRAVIASFNDITGAYVNHTVDIPADVVTRVFISCTGTVPNGSSIQVFLQSPLATSSGDTQLLMYQTATGGDNSGGGAGGEVLSNTSKQIRAKGVRTGTATYTAYAYGWEELRVPSQ
jgi:hypothetical protein